MQNERTRIRNTAARGAVLLCASALIIAAPRTGAAAGSGPAGIVKRTVDRIVDVLEDPQLQKPENRSKRDKKLKSIADDMFDWRKMARRSLGRHWRNIMSEEQKDFTDLFSEYLAHVYLDRIDLFREKLGGLAVEDIEYYDKEVEDDFAQIKSRIALEGTDHTFHYKLFEKHGRWRVYDVVIDGAGIVVNYRTQFNALLVSGTFDEMMKKLRHKLKKLKE